jgi:hypothetical protein
MTTPPSTEERISRWLEEEAGGPLPDRVLEASFATTRGMRQVRAPAWRSFTMSRPIPGMIAVGAAAVLIVAGVLYFQPVPSGNVGGAAPSPSPSTSATPMASASPSNAGIITLTDTGCDWENNPGTLTNADFVNIALRNETDDYADFQLHWVRAGRRYAEGVAFVEEIARRLTTGEEWPPNDIWILVDAQGVVARSETIASWPTAGTGQGPAPEMQRGPLWNLETGSYGVICSANTSPTGDVLTTFLVGPLDLHFVAEEAGSPSPR